MCVFQCQPKTLALCTQQERDEQTFCTPWARAARATERLAECPAGSLRASERLEARCCALRCDPPTARRATVVPVPARPCGSGPPRPSALKPPTAGPKTKDRTDRTRVINELSSRVCCACMSDSRQWGGVSRKSDARLHSAAGAAWRLAACAATATGAPLPGATPPLA